MSSIDFCVDQLDEKIISDELVPKLVHLIRKGVGLPTKAGTAKILSTLAYKYPNELRPHVPLLIKGFFFFFSLKFYFF